MTVMEPLAYILSRYFNSDEVEWVRKALAEGRSKAEIVDHLHYHYRRTCVGFTGPNRPYVRTLHDTVEYMPSTWKANDKPSFVIPLRKLIELKVVELLPQRQLALF